MILSENNSDNSANLSVDAGETREDIPNVQSKHNPEIFKSISRDPKVFVEVKKVFSDIRESQIKAAKITANIVIVLLLTALVTKQLASHCPSEPDTDLLEIFPKFSVPCEPFEPNVSRVIVDVDLNSSSHCYGSRSCVELGDSLHKTQGKFRYNFILGTFGFVFAPLGYNCASEEWEEALYIRLPVESIYYGNDFIAARNSVTQLQEVLREGLECGKLQHNFSLVASGCGIFNSWCTKALKDLVFDKFGEVDTNVVRLNHFDIAQPDHHFNPLSIQRVYSHRYKLIVCDENHG